MGRRQVVLAWTLALVLAATVPTDAYIGPGAGFALLSSFFVLLTTVVVAIASLLFWPFRAAVAAASAADASARAASSGLIIVGLDGQDPKLTDRFMPEGLLPNFERLAQTGLLSPAAHDVPVSVAGGLVVVQHRHQSRPAQHLRFPRSRSADVPAGAVVDARRQASTRFFKLGRYRHAARQTDAAAVAASRSRSGPSSANIGSGARFCASRSRFLPTTSTERN